MLFLIIGVALLVMKYMEIPPVAAFSWWLVFAPFGLAVAWWSWADASGYTKRKQVDKENARKQDRLDKNRANLGMGPTKRR